MTLDLLPGDVLLAGHQGSPIARCVRILSDSPWNHAGIVGTDGTTMIHCPGANDPVIDTMPVTDLVQYLRQPGYGSTCITVMRTTDPAHGQAAAARAQQLAATQPFEYSMGQDMLLGVLLWAQQGALPVQAVLAAVLEQVEERTDDVFSAEATSCAEFVWQCYDDAGIALNFADPYYRLDADSQKPEPTVTQFRTPDPSPQHPGVPNRLDTPLYRLVERIVMLGRKPQPNRIVETLQQQPAQVRFVLPASRADSTVIPDLLVPRDFADSPSFVVAGGWPDSGHDQ